MPRAVLEKEDKAMNKTDKFHTSWSLQLLLSRFNKNISGRDGDSEEGTVLTRACVSGSIVRPAWGRVAVFELVCCKGKLVSLNMFPRSLSIIIILF